MNEIRLSPKQTLFLASPADIVIYGGAAGGGKTFSLLMYPLRHIMSVKGFSAVVFRRTYAEIENVGGLWDESLNLYNGFGAKSVKSDMKWIFGPYDNVVKFSHLQHDTDIHKHQGGQYPLIAFDELTHFSEMQFWYLLSRNRSSCGIQPYIRATTNPDPDSFVAKLISWWIDNDGTPIPERTGVIRYFARIAGELIWEGSPEDFRRHGIDPSGVKSFTFISATLDDNTALLKNDPAYRTNLLSLPPVDRARLLDGNWKTKHIGKYFKNPQFREWRTDIDNIMYIDPAFGGDDNTAITIAGIVEGGYHVRGATWNENVIDCYDRIIEYAKRYRVGSIYIEINKDEGACRRDLSAKWPSVVGVRETQNKHMRILENVYRNFSSVYFASDIDKDPDQSRWISGVLAYEELCDHDDEADSLAGALRRLIKSRGSFV